MTLTTGKAGVVSGRCVTRGAVGVVSRWWWACSCDGTPCRSSAWPTLSVDGDAYQGRLNSGPVFDLCRLTDDTTLEEVRACVWRADGHSHRGRPQTRAMWTHSARLAA